MTEPRHDPEKPRRQGAWSDLETITEPHTGLSVIITERIRGPHAYSYQISQRDDRGMNRFIQYPIQGLDKVPVNGEGVATPGDIIKTLVKMAEDYIAKLQPKAKLSPKTTTKSPPKTFKGLSQLAKEDAQAKGLPYKGPSEKQKDKKRKARASS
jgi:hypothetical protein